MITLFGKEKHGQELKEMRDGVYFKGDKIEPKKGFPTPVRYITIETSVRPKPHCEHSKR